MARRATHTPEQLSLMILDAAQAIIAEQGLAGLSAREVARRIEYSPGTIYNVFTNLDDVVLQIEARMLDALDQRLAGVICDPGQPEASARSLARAYLDFTHEHPRLWNLLFEHHLPATAVLPEWYQTKLEALLAHVERAISPLFVPSEQAALKRAARVLWAGVHGITSLSTADKLGIITSETAGALVDDLVRTYLAGLSRAR